MGIDVLGAINDARNWVGDRLDDVQAAKERVGTAIDGAVHGAEDAIDGFRRDVVAFGGEHGGFVGRQVAQELTDTIGVVEGGVLAAYDMGKGIVQLADGLGQITSPLEWATHADRNLQRLETTGNALTALNNLTSPVAWATNPSANVRTAEALWDGVTAGYQDAAADGDYSKFAGRLVVDVGSLFIGVGEANAVVRGAEGASAVARIGETANAVDKVADGARVLDELGTLGRGAGTADDVARSAAALERAETALRGGDLALAGRTVDEQAAAISALSNAGRVDEARALLKPLLDARDYDGLVARLDLSSPPGGTYFWSGNAQEAERVATSLGGRTLESTPGGRIIDGWSDIPAWNDGGQLVWSTASRQFAAGASGDVTVVLTRAKATTQGGDVWRNVESGVVAQLREAGVVTDVRVIVLDPVNPGKLVPLTGLAAESALRDAGLPSN